MPRTTVPDCPTSIAVTPHGDRGIYIYCSLLLLSSGMALLAFTSLGISLGSPLAVAALASMALWAERQSIRLSGTTELSVAFLPLVFAAVAFGPVAAMIVGAASL